MWSKDDPMCNEAKKIVWEVAPYLKGRGIDIGAGMFKILPQAISVDNCADKEIFGHPIIPDVRVQSGEKLDIFATQSMDFVFSSHLLEHIVDYKAALQEWWRVIKFDGILALYLPHKDFYPNVGTEYANNDHKHDFLPKDIIDAMESITGGGWDLLECQERNEDKEYSFLLVFKKQHGKFHNKSYLKPKHEKRILICRFGAFGDLMQASSVFAGLKKQGWHITLMTSPPGIDVVLTDPNIDEFMILDKDQIPNGDLGSFWRHQAKNYDKFINLSESVEGTFLALQGRSTHAFAPAARHAVMNYNYLEFQHLLAGVPHDPQVKFYPKPEEKEWARKTRAKMGKYVILWSLAGSSVHKTWAGLDAILAALMLNYKDVDVVLCGGPEAVILEAGWEKEPRVHLTCGKWSIRQTLSFITEADLVMGPETGVLNAASHEEVPKLIFLSHSTEENLTRDWVNTISLSSKETKCKGRGNNEAPTCHQLHYGWDYCTKDEGSGTAQCQADITIDECYYHLELFIDRKLKEVA